MKGKLIILIIISFLIKSGVSGQALIKSGDMMAPKQIRGMKAITGSYYQSPYGPGAAISYSSFFNNKISLLVGASFNSGIVGHSKYKRYLFEIDGNKNVLNLKDVLFVNVGIISGFGNENVSFEYSENSTEGFLYEFGVSAGIEIYVLPVLTIEAGIRQVAFGNSELGKRHYYLPVSLRFYY